MSKRNNVIEINGKRYDAHTGASLNHGTGTHHAAPTHHATIKHVQTGHTGHPASSKQTHPAQTEPMAHGGVINSHAQPEPKFKVHEAVKAKPHHSHTPQPSKTLMRHVVKKPGVPTKSHSRAVHPLDAASKRQVVVPKPSASRLDEKRLSHAKHVAQSKHIQRFHHGHPMSLASEAEQIVVSVLPPRPLVPMQARPVRPAPARKSSQTTADLLDLALRRADSHKALTPKQRKVATSKRITSISFLSLAGLVLFMLVAFQNVTTVKLQVASAKAGFAVTLPQQQPSGYSLSHLKYSSGQVALNYASNTDDRAYAITEKATTWDSQALKSNVLASNGSFEAVEKGGRTLFLYGDQNAMWVSGGIWYQIETNGSLSQRQLLDLATSM